MKSMKLTFQQIAVVLFTAIIVSSSCKKDDDEVIKSSLKQVLTFQFAGLTPTVNAIINETTHTIVADLPAGTVVTALVPTITISPKASINPASGVAQNFTNPLNYTVTAEDGSKIVYTVTVTVAGSAVLDPLTLEAAMSSNQTLVNRNSGIDYIVAEDFTIDGNALLTVEPGVTIAFSSVSSSIIVNENAGIRMIGTAIAPIILTGPTNNQNEGSWSGVEIKSNRSDNEMAVVQIINAGSDQYFGALYLAGSALLKMHDCTIDGGLGYGLYINEGRLSTFTNNTIKNCNKYPIYSEILKGIISIEGTNTLTGNTYNSIFINGSTGNDADVTLHEQTVPYFFNGGYHVETGTTLTIEPGCVIEIGAGAGFDASGKLIASGTSSKPITFTGKSKEAGYWGYIEIRSALANKLDYCTIEYGGNGGYSMLYIDDAAVVSLLNNTFKNSSNHGASRNLSTYSGITASGNTFQSCASGNVYNRDEDNVSPNF